MKNSIYIIDTADKRGLLIKSKLEELKKTVIPLDKAPKECQNTNVLLFPKSIVPENINFSGSTVFSFKNICIDNTKNVNLQQNSEFWGKNSLLTAEGLLCELIKETPYSLTGSSVIVIGFGKTGKSICQILRGLVKNLSVLTLSQTEFSDAASMGIDCYNDVDSVISKRKNDFETIINTSPVEILAPDNYVFLNAKYLFDITTAIDLIKVEKSGIKALRCPTLPARYSPDSASKLILDCILKGE